MEDSSDQVHGPCSTHFTDQTNARKSFHEEEEHGQEIDPDKVVFSDDSDDDDTVSPRVSTQSYLLDDEVEDEHVKFVSSKFSLPVTTKVLSRNMSSSSCCSSIVLREELPVT